MFGQFNQKKDKALKLYGTLLSPYTLRAVLVARAKGNELDPEIPPSAGPEREAYLKINPTGKFPFLDDDGFYLPESSVIADYLDEVLPGPKLWPALPKERARAALFARLIDVWIAPGQSGFIQAIRMEDAGPARESAWTTFTRGIQAIEHYRDPKHVWIYGDDFGHPDAALIPWLFSGERFDKETGLSTYLKANSKLADYWAKVKDTEIGARAFAEMTARADAIFGKGGSLSDLPKSFAEAQARSQAAKEAQQ